MPSPFPGMDPYLETPLLWRDVHGALIAQIQSALNPQLRPQYVARVELRVYISDEDDPGRKAIIPDIRVEAAQQGKKPRRPKNGAAVNVLEPIIIPFLIDDEIEEARIEIHEPVSKSLVAVIEVLSPTNKIRGSRGRASFMDKRREILGGPVHWVEIDLLRAGEPSVTRPSLVPSDYRILVYRAGERRGHYWPFSVRQPLPAVKIPLRQPDEDVTLDLAAVFRAAYEQGAYDLSVDYRKEPDPPLDAEDTLWAEQLLREQGLRKAKRR